jgi:16S rRNA processing protein RimM
MPAEAPPVGNVIAPSNPDALLKLGVVGRAHGLRGGCHVHAFNPGSPIWRPGLEVSCVPQDGASGSGRPERRLKVTEARRTPDAQVLVTFEGVATREAVESLRGLALAVPPASLPAPGPDEVYHHEVVGWQALDLAGVTIGTVTGVLSLPGQDLLAIARPTAGPSGPAREALVPFVGAIVREIRRDARALVLDPPEGLLDLDADATPDDHAAPDEDAPKARTPRGSAKGPKP